MRNKKVIVALIVVMLLTVQVLLPVSAAYSDVDSSMWYAGVVNKWGYLLSDGDEVNPEAPITRAEFARVLNGVMSFPAASPAFADVNSGTEYASDIGALQAAGVVVGRDDGMFDPSATIKRSEVAVMFARAFGLEVGAAPSFNDNSSIPEWVLPYLATLQGCGYMNGDTDGNFSPDRLFVRAEIFQVMENVGTNFMSAGGTVTEVLPGNVIITQPNTVVKDVTITGNVIIAPSVGDGDVKFENTTVNGTIFVRGGGPNSIIVTGTSSVERIFVDKSGEGSVRISVEGGANVSYLFVNDGNDAVIIDGTVSAVTVSSDVEVVINATVEQLNVAAENAAVTVSEKATVKEMYVAPEAVGTNLTVSGTVESVQVAAPAATVEATSTAKITNLAVTGSAAGASVDNKGTVENMTVKSADTAVANTGTISNCSAPEAVTVTGTPPAASSTVEAGSVNDVYA